MISWFPNWWNNSPHNIRYDYRSKRLPYALRWSLTTKSTDLFIPCEKSALELQNVNFIKAVGKWEESYKRLNLWKDCYYRGVKNQFWKNKIRLKSRIIWKIHIENFLEGDVSYKKIQREIFDLKEDKEKIIKELKRLKHPSWCQRYYIYIFNRFIDYHYLTTLKYKFQTLRKMRKIEKNNFREVLSDIYLLWSTNNQYFLNYFLLTLTPDEYKRFSRFSILRNEYSEVTNLIKNFNPGIFWNIFFEDKRDRNIFFENKRDRNIYPWILDLRFPRNYEKLFGKPVYLLFVEPAYSIKSWFSPVFLKKRKYYKHYSTCLLSLLLLGVHDKEKIWFFSVWLHSLALFHNQPDYKKFCDKIVYSVDSRLNKSNVSDRFTQESIRENFNSPIHKELSYVFAILGTTMILLAGVFLIKGFIFLSSFPLLAKGKIALISKLFLLLPVFISSVLMFISYYRNIEIAYTYSNIEEKILDQFVILGKEYLSGKKIDLKKISGTNLLFNDIMQALKLPEPLYSRVKIFFEKLGGLNPQNDFVFSIIQNELISEQFSWRSRSQTLNKKGFKHQDVVKDKNSELSFRFPFMGMRLVSLASNSKGYPNSPKNEKTMLTIPPLEIGEGVPALIDKNDTISRDVFPMILDKNPGPWGSLLNNTLINYFPFTVLKKKEGNPNLFQNLYCFSRFLLGATLQTAFLSYSLIGFLANGETQRTLINGKKEILSKILYRPNSWEIFNRGADKVSNFSKEWQNSPNQLRNMFNTILATLGILFFLNLLSQYLQKSKDEEKNFFRNISLCIFIIILILKN